MRISTIIWTDGMERQVWAQALQVGEPAEHLARVDLGNDSEIIIPLYSVRMIVTQDLPEDAISPDITGSSSPRP